MEMSHQVHMKGHPRYICHQLLNLVIKLGFSLSTYLVSQVWDLKYSRLGLD